MRRTPLLALLALLASATLITGALADGVALFVDGPNGSYLRGGGDEGALDAVSIAAAAAALLTVQPVAHVNAKASSEVESLLAPPEDVDAATASRPKALLSVHVAGVTAERALEDAFGHRVAAATQAVLRRRRIAGDARLAADAVDALRDGDDGVGLLYSDLTGDCDDHDGAVLWPGVGAAIAEIATAANATAAARAIEFDAEDLLGTTLGGGGGGVFALPKGGGGAAIDDAIGELVCFHMNADAAFKHEAARVTKRGGGAGARKKAPAPATRTRPPRLFRATLTGGEKVRRAHGARSSEYAASVRLTAAAVRIAMEKLSDARRGEAVGVMTFPGEDEVEARAEARRRALRAAEDEAAEAEAAAERSRRASTASSAVVAALFLFSSVCLGMVALCAMKFPRDALLWPPEKEDWLKED